MNFKFYDYDVIITRKNNKNLYIRVSNDLKIMVNCPLFYTRNMILKLLEENKNSINKMIVKQKNKNNTKKEEKYKLLGKEIDIIYDDVKRYKEENNRVIVKDDTMLNSWFKKKAKEIFKLYLDEAYYAFEEKIPYPNLKIRVMKTRWGVCNRKTNTITLNLELIKKDQACLNYVIVHELSHFLFFDHSKSFWNTVEKYCPEYKIVRKELNE